jgi:hypothetical protein
MILQESNMIDKYISIQMGRQIGFDNLLLIGNIYYALIQLGFYDVQLYKILENHGLYTEKNIRTRYMSTFKYILKIYNPNYDINLLIKDTKKIKAIHGSMNNIITQQMYSDVLLTFCAPIFFFEKYNINFSHDDKLNFIQLWAFIGTELGIDYDNNICLKDINYINLQINDLISKYLKLLTYQNKIHKIFVKCVYIPLMLIKPNNIFVTNSFLKYICSTIIISKIINYIIYYLYK